MGDGTVKVGVMKMTIKKGAMRAGRPLRSQRMRPGIDLCRFVLATPVRDSPVREALSGGSRRVRDRALIRGIAREEPPGRHDPSA
jgi:hypothetical protein